MSAPHKPKGGQFAPMTQIKMLPRDQQDLISSWRYELVTEKPMTNKQIKERITAEFGIDLTPGWQISRFWQWYDERQDKDRFDDLMEEFEKSARARNPKWSPEEVREACLQFFLKHTVRKENVSEFTSVMKLCQKESFTKKSDAQKDRHLDQRERRIALQAEKAAAQARAQAALNEPKKPKGVITPETLRRIEEELRLL